MKNTTFFYLVFLFLHLIACKKDPATVSDTTCKQYFIAQHQLLPYTGQNLGCSSYYYALYLLDDKEYFIFDSPCADMISIPLDCNNTLYCSSIDDPELTFFYQNAQYVGIIGVVP